MKKDFPDFLGSMTIKELRQGLRARMFVVPFIAVHALVITALVLEYLVIGMVSGAYVVDFEEFVQHTLFWLIAGLIILVVTPLAGITSLQQEARGRNMELLLLTRLTRWNVVLGKWMMLNAIGALMIFSLLPYMLVRYFLGGVDVGLNLIIGLFMVLGNLAMNALVIGASGYRNYMLRFLVVMSGVGAALGSAAAMVGFAYGINNETFGVIAVMNAFFASALFVLFGLQLARTKLRLYEHPYEPPPSRLVLTLILCAPVFILMFCALTFFWTFGAGGLVGAGLLIWFLLMIDRAPKRGKMSPGLQP